MLRVDTKVFEGPLDLLLYLISRRQVNIYDIPISEITQEFLEFLSSMRELDIPLASEFLSLAATLLRIKTEFLLNPSAEKDPRKPLVRMIEDYLSLQAQVRALQEAAKKAQRLLTNDPSEDLLSLQDSEDMKILNTPDDLKAAYENLFVQSETQEKLLELRSDELKVSKKMAFWRRVLKQNEQTTFKAQTVGKRKIEAAVMFSAVLELARLKEASLTQLDMDVLIKRVHR